MTTLLSPPQFSVTMLFSVLLFSGCTLAPVTPRIQAEPLGKGNLQVNTWIAPAPAISAAYGLTERFDVGGDIEQFDMVSIWSRYSIVNTNFASLAATAGIFRKSNPNNASGYYAGSVLSGPINKRMRFYMSYRLSQITYDPVDLNEDSRPLTDDEIISGVDSRDSEDLSKTSQFNLGFSIRLRSKAGLNVGVGCQYHHENNDPQIESRPCGPLIGLSWGHK